MPGRSTDTGTPDLRQLEAWLLVGSQHLYGTEVLEQVERDAAIIATGLSEMTGVPVRVVAKPVLTTADAITETCLAANAAADCVGVICWMHTFSPAKMWIAGLRALRKPLAQLHTQLDRDLPWADIDMDFMNLHQSAHGDREFGFIATRMGLERVVIAGHWRDEAVSTRLGVWARAAAGLREARGLRVCRFGDNMRDVAVTEGDKVETQIRLGVSVNTHPVTELSTAIATVSDEDVTALVETYATEYEVDPRLAATGECHSSQREAARIEIGLRGFLERGGFAAFTDTFEDLGDLAQLPGIAVQRLMADGYGFGAEGDWKTAALVRIVKVMAAGLPGGTSFMEDYTYHLAPDGPAVLGAHMLEVCPSIAGDPPRCAIHPLSIGNRADPVRLVFDAAPGPAVVVGLVDLGDRLRLVVNEIEIIDAPQRLPRLPVARAVWRPAPSLATAAEAWILAGGSHHTALSQSLSVQHFADLAQMAGIELVVIDRDTDLRSFVRELRWNDSSYRLGAGR